MADASKPKSIMYGGYMKPIDQLSRSQITDINLWQKQMAALGKQEEKEKKEEEKKKKENSKGGEGSYKRMELASVHPKTKAAEMLSILYGNNDPFLKALTRL